MVYLIFSVISNSQKYVVKTLSNFYYKLYLIFKLSFSELDTVLNM